MRRNLSATRATQPRTPTSKLGIEAAMSPPEIAESPHPTHNCRRAGAFDQPVVLRVDQLDIDPKAVTRLLNASLDNIADAELPTDGSLTGSQVCVLGDGPRDTCYDLAGITIHDSVDDDSGLDNIVVTTTRVRTAMLGVVFVIFSSIFLLFLTQVAGAAC